MRGHGYRRLWWAFLLVSSCGVSAPGRPAIIDFAVVNATVWTGDSLRPVVEAIAISDGQIVALGPTEEIRSLADGGNIVDADGALIMPGFIDTHAHLFHAGRRLLQEGRAGQLYDIDESLLSVEPIESGTPEENDEELSAALEYLASQGVTSVHHMGDWNDLEALQRAELNGRLTARVNAVLPITTTERLSHAIESRQFGGLDGKGSAWLKVGAARD